MNARTYAFFVATLFDFERQLVVVVLVGEHLFAGGG
jgi:hypothetical protein